MKPCSPANWSNRRLVTGGLPMLVACGAVYWLTGALMGVAGLITIWLLIDWLSVVIGAPRPPGDVTVRLTSSPERDGSEYIAGGTIRVTAVLHATRTLRSALVLPFLTEGLEVIGPGGARGHIKRGGGAEVVFRFRLIRPGVVVLPGVMIRTLSLLGFFTRYRAALDRRTVTVLPNYGADGHAVLMRFIRPMREVGALRRHVIRRTGTDLHEIREYQPGDSRRDVDWRATARTRKMMVRERESPREYSIRVVLDTSLDMTHGERQERFVNVSAFIARLAYVAMSQSMRFQLHQYGDRGGHRTTLQGGVVGFARLLGDVATLPRRALVEAVSMGKGDALEARLRTVWRKIVSPSGGRSIAGTPGRFVNHYLPGLEHDEAIAETIADFAPTYAAQSQRRCDECSGVVFADDAACPACQADLGRQGLAMRASMLVTTLALAMRSTHGREMLILISALRGGECAPEVADTLRAAAAGHRTVHVIVPEIETLARMRPRNPGSLGNVGDRTDAASNALRLLRVAQFQHWRNRLADAGILIHSIDDPSQLDAIVVDLIEREVLSVR